MLQMKAVLLFQDPHKRAELKNQLSIFSNLEIVADFDDFKAADKYLRAHGVNVIFAEYSDSISFFIGSVTMSAPNMMTVLFHADSTCAHDALKAGALEFFSLPMDPAELQRIIKKLAVLYELFSFKDSLHEYRLIVKTEDGYKVVIADDILFIERIDRKLNMICRGGNAITVSGYTMADIENLLVGGKFYRCSKSIIVNLDNVKSVTVDHKNNYCSLKLYQYEGGIPVSRQKKNEIIQSLQDRYSSTGI